MSKSEKITAYIEKNQDWKGTVMKKVRELVHEIQPEIQEEWKWNSPVWSYNGMVCSIGAFKKHVSLTFFQGASLPNQSLFNSEATSKNTRSVMWKDSSEFDSKALKPLIEAAINANIK